MSGLRAFSTTWLDRVSQLVTVNQELDAALDVAGHVLPIPTLASDTAGAATVEVPESPSLPEPVPAAAPVPTPAEPVAESPRSRFRFHLHPNLPFPFQRLKLPRHLQ